MMQDKGKEDATAEFLAAHLEAWGEAIVANDAAAFGRFTTEDWVLLGPGGLMERSRYLAAVKSGDLSHDAFEVEVTRVRSYGDAAVVTAHVTNSGTFRGQPFSSDEWTTDVYVRRGDEWLCVLTQLTPLPAGN